MSFNNQFAPFRNNLAIQLVLSPALIAQGTSAEQTFTAPGVPAATVPCMVNVNKPTVQAGLILGGFRNSAANQIGICFGNIPNAGGNITPTAGETYNVEAKW